MSHNIVVEGDSDVEYFEKADEIHFLKEGRRLIGVDLAVFAVGKGEAGGTLNMVPSLQAVRHLMGIDPPDDDDPILFLAVVDDDHAGRKAISILKGSGWQEYVNLFRVVRSFPRQSRNTIEVKNHITHANARWRALEKCEIEDLIACDLLDVFAAENPGYLKVQPVKHDSQHHYEWETHAKAPLRRFIQANAMQSDLENLIDFIRSLRYMLRLDPSGALEE